MIRGAEICDWGNHRYRLWRYWDDDLPVVGFVMLNPSKADAQRDDDTIEKCIRFAESWGYGGIEVCNLFAWRAKNPSRMKRAPDPVGAGNDAAIDTLFGVVPTVVAAWGNDGNFMDRSSQITTRYVGRFHYLKINKLVNHHIRCICQRLLN